jgi:hypothetical protein
LPRWSATLTVALHALTVTSKIRRYEETKKAREDPEKIVPRKRSDGIRVSGWRDAGDAGEARPASPQRDPVLLLRFFDSWP